LHDVCQNRSKRAGVFVLVFGKNNSTNTVENGVLKLVFGTKAACSFDILFANIAGDVCQNRSKRAGVFVLVFGKNNSKNSVENGVLKLVFGSKAACSFAILFANIAGDVCEHASGV
jgi:succinyl-CoA synthetase beta subunit